MPGCIPLLVTMLLTQLGVCAHEIARICPGLQANSKPLEQLEGELHLRSDFGVSSIADSARSGLADSVAQGILLHIKELALLLYRERQQQEEDQDVTH